MGERHLKYDSIESWMAAENVPPNFIAIENEELRDKYINEYGELRRHLFAKHAATLSDLDQQKLRDGNHPSQSHAFATEAEPYCRSLDRELRMLAVVADEIVLGWYHMDRIVLSVTLDESKFESTAHQRPWLFQGFEVFYAPKQIQDAT
jgi:hypothetical protein